VAAITAKIIVAVVAAIEVHLVMGLESSKKSLEI
jgi:hypothetical protein